MALIEPRSGAKTGKKLTEADYKEVKDLLYTGESIVDVARRLGRSDQTVRNIQMSKDMDDYRVIARKAFEKYRDPNWSPTFKNRGGVKPEEKKQLVPMERYGRLKQMREHLDEVLVDFIIGEIEENHRELALKLKKLEQENEKLKKELEQLREPDFVKTLKSKLNVGKEESNEHTEPISNTADKFSPKN